MSDQTSIEWTDASWPIIRGCTKISQGCDNCWAIADAHLRAGSSNAKARAHFEGLTQIQNGRPNWTGTVRLDESILDWPLRWKKPRKIFVASSGDLFHESLPFEDLVRVWRVVLDAAQAGHTMQILTKRAERMREVVLILMNRIFGAHWRMPDRIWLGVSVEDEPTARLRVPSLLAATAAVRWVSYEPALGPVDWARWLPSPCYTQGRATARGIDGLDLIVIGGESGRRARPFDLACARNTITQCRAAGVACFVKQFGARPFEIVECPMCEGHAVVGNSPCICGCGEARVELGLHDRKGADMSEWPEWARVRELPRG